MVRSEKGAAESDNRQHEPPATPAVNPVQSGGQKYPHNRATRPGKTNDFFGSNKKLYVLNTHFSSQEEAEEAAKAKWQDLHVTGPR